MRFWYVGCGEGRAREERTYCRPAGLGDIEDGIIRGRRCESDVRLIEVRCSPRRSLIDRYTCEPTPIQIPQLLPPTITRTEIRTEGRTKDAH